MSIDHGTRRGYQQHKAIRGMPCEACVEANRAYMRSYMRRNYSPTKRRERYERAKVAGYYDGWVNP